MCSACSVSFFTTLFRFPDLFLIPSLTTIENGSYWMTSRLTMAIPLTERRSWLLLLTQCAVGRVALAALTAFAFWLHFPIATVGFIYLLIVVLAALHYGIWQATFISLIAVSCLNYFFIPPIFSFVVSDERDWIALVSFQICALIVSRLSSREQKIARDANYQRIQMKKLYELSRGILLFDLHSPPGPQLVQLIRRTFNADDVAIFDAACPPRPRGGLASGRAADCQEGVPPR